MIAVVSAGAMATFMSGVAIPIVTGHLTSQVEVLRTTISGNSDAIRDLHQRLENSAKAYSELKNELEATKVKERAALKLYAEARMKNPFTVGVGYPRGLEAVQIGAPSSRLKEVYPQSKVEARGRWIVVESAHPVFNRVTYYIDDESKTPTVTHILFFGGDGVSSDWLVEQFNAAFGEKKLSLKDGDSVWTVGKSLAIKHTSGERNFVLVKY